MKQLYIYFGILLALLLLPGGTDAAKLVPAQLVYVQRQGDDITVRTDMGNMGKGRDLTEAFVDLEKTTSGKVFLDTADYLLVNEAAINLLPELKSWLKGDCYICVADEIEDLEGAAVYLDAHPPELKLRELSRENGDLPLLIEIDERFCLKG